jgi:hypothetical protein
MTISDYQHKRVMLPPPNDLQKPCHHAKPSERLSKLLFLSSITTLPRSHNTCSLGPIFFIVKSSLPLHCGIIPFSFWIKTDAIAQVISGVQLSSPSRRTMLRRRDPQQSLEKGLLPRTDPYNLPQTETSPAPQYSTGYTSSICLSARPLRGGIQARFDERTDLSLFIDSWRHSCPELIDGGT